ncbi:18857_t:CDS:2 [Dentiscutata erythropus]|uniref:18857_t:CDS:1 n=1 Tax=Dentiscutata erythropus TaxID=1348616 RepID=A0A9N9J5P0_9GLOM|nr:18857_t:CDS:2 [Dentiscutata erythropus]
MSSLKAWFNAAISGREFNEILYDDLKELVHIGRGAFGEVYKANCVSIENTVAVKKIFKSYLEKQDEFGAFIKELKLHRQLDNNRIIKFIGISKGLSDPAIWISIEKGAREAPISNTPVGYIELYKKFWDTYPYRRPNISEIVTCLSTMRLEPVYDSTSSQLETSRSLNSHLSSIIGTDHNSTLTFDDKFVISLKSSDETLDYGKCKCGHKFTNVEWCNKCESENFQSNFNHWTSGGYSTINSAIWRDGPREEWDEKTCRWKRASNTKVIVRYSKESTSDISMWLKEVKLHLCCDKTIQCYGITRNHLTGEYGLVQKYASYGDLRSFISQKAFIGWWQKLKILEGII